MLITRNNRGATLALLKRVALLGLKNGVNQVFTTPDPFIPYGNLPIEIVRNGQDLIIDDDFTVSESSGPGTGFNTVTFIYWKPYSVDKLLATYVKDVSVP